VHFPSISHILIEVVMELVECITCRYYLGHSETVVRCKYFPDQIIERVLVLYEIPGESWIIDCPFIPTILSIKHKNVWTKQT
jgi:hypothetical protein